MPIRTECSTNELIGALSPDDLTRWLPQLEVVNLAPGEVIFDADHLNGFLYFPTTATVSMMNALPDRPPESVAVFGSDGAIGVAIYIAGIAAPRWAVVLNGGRACRMKSAAFLAEFHRPGGPMPQMLKFTTSLTAKLVAGIARAV